jgi:hypothetical protein
MYKDGKKKFSTQSWVEAYLLLWELYTIANRVMPQHRDSAMNYLLQLEGFDNLPPPYFPLQAMQNLPPLPQGNPVKQTAPPLPPVRGRIDEHQRTWPIPSPIPLIGQP